LGVTAPAQGLTLMRVFYENDEQQAREYFDYLAENGFSV
jgi:hypothetical protein